MAPSSPVLTPVFTAAFSILVGERGVSMALRVLLERRPRRRLDEALRVAICARVRVGVHVASRGLHTWCVLRAAAHCALHVAVRCGACYVLCAARCVLCVPRDRLFVERSAICTHVRVEGKITHKCRRHLVTTH